jgi:hypothetical protein
MNEHTNNLPPGVKAGDTDGAVAKMTHWTVLMPATVDLHLELAAIDADEAEVSAREWLGDVFWPAWTKRKRRAVRGVTLCNLEISDSHPYVEELPE